MLFRKSYSDSDIISGIQAGGVQRERSTDTLFRSHHKLVRHGIRRFHLSQEEAQEAYLDALTALCRQIEGDKFRGDSKISTYLFRIFENKCKNKLTARKSNKQTWAEEIPDLPSNAQNMLEELVEQEEFEGIESLLNQLGGQCKEILVLSEFQGYSQTEIAEKLGLKSARVVATSRYRCIAKLKKLLAHTQTPSSHITTKTDQ